MASKQSLANKEHYEALAAIVAKGPLRPEEQIEWNDIHWPGLTAEPGGVDYVEVNAGGIPAMWILPKRAVDDRVILYSHGGGFVSGSIYTHRKMVGHLAKAVGSRALLFEYPYAHQKKYPAQLDTTVAVCRCLLAQQIVPEHVAVAADSSGAILTVGLLQRARAERVPLPAAVMIISGWLDMALTGPSYVTNREKDVFFSKSRRRMAGRELPGGRRSPRYVRQPTLCGSRRTPTDVSAGRSRRNHRRRQPYVRRPRERGRCRGPVRRLPGDAAHLSDDGRPRPGSRWRDPPVCRVGSPKAWTRRVG
jgi:acetyl esterase/lipase